MKKMKISDVVYQPIDPSNIKDLTNRRMRISDVVYHPNVAKISFMVYGISCGLGLAVMPKPKIYLVDYSQSLFEQLLRESKEKGLNNSATNLKKADITNHLKDS